MQEKIKNNENIDENGVCLSVNGILSQFLFFFFVQFSSTQTSISLCISKKRSSGNPPIEAEAVAHADTQMSDRLDAIFAWRVLTVCHLVHFRSRRVRSCTSATYFFFLFCFFAFLSQTSGPARTTVDLSVL